MVWVYTNSMKVILIYMLLTSLLAWASISGHGSWSSHKLPLQYLPFQKSLFQSPQFQQRTRFHSTLSHPSRRPHLLNPAQLAFRHQWPVFRRYVSVYQLEERANSESDNPHAQAKYLEVQQTLSHFLHLTAFWGALNRNYSVVICLCILSHVCYFVVCCGV